MSKIKETAYTFEDLETHITESHLRYSGGYPYDAEWIGESFVVAELSGDNETRLGVYERQDLIEWLAMANEFRAEVLSGVESEDFNDTDIFQETQTA